MNPGNHFGGYKYRNKRNKSNHFKNSFWSTVITAITGTVIKDLTSNNSKIKQIVNKLYSSKKIEDKQNKKTVINAEYKVVEDEAEKAINDNKLPDENK
ncbi:MAG: hypothetical protein APR54_04065 [Candidatus Cloacimonas sp. SDB]|nr:MAG: hypothetical protein APR54_04065 [Candidatus Cloacimonas sp. SDB]